jgi:hypothetical protein
MLKPFISLTFFFVCFNLFAQNIEVAGGFNKNDFYDHNEANDQNLNSKYYSAAGYSFGISFEHTYDSLPLKYILKIDNYKGTLQTSYGGHGGGSSTNADVNKLSIALDIYLINIRVLRNIRLNIGGSLSYLLHDKTIGDQSWISYSPNFPYIYSGKDSNIEINKFNFGLITRVAYEIKIKDDLYLLPQYLFYYGLTNEFLSTEADTKSYRHYFEMGLIKIINEGSR